MRRALVGVAVTIALIVIVIISAAAEQATGSKAPCYVVGGVTTCSK
jgi:hypothetical protein